MSISAERIKHDLRKIEELSKSVNGRIRVKTTSGNPINVIILEINYPTVPSKDYPKKVQSMTEVKIELLSRYPFQEPSATITTPVYHPNVYSSGKICFGAKWMPTQGLDLLVRRIIQIITFDKDILNEKSPANAQALHWYRDLIRSNPSAFPTERLIFRENSRNQMRWTNKDACEDQKVLVSCDNCKASLRVPKDKHINVTCPKCNYKFFVKT